MRPFPIGIPPSPPPHRPQPLPSAERLFKAIELGDVNVVKDHLLRSPTDVHAYHHDMTALSLAVKHQHIGITQLLLKDGAPVDAQKGLALKTAATYGHTEAAELLIQQGACIDMPDAEDYTALMIAAANGQLSMVELLLDHKANIYHISKDDHCTALLLAVFHGQRPSDRYELRSLNNQIKARYPTYSYDYFQAIQTLRCKVEKLQDAMAANQLDTVRLLLEKGAPRNLISKTHHDCALYDAVTHGRAALVHLLLSHGEYVKFHESLMMAKQCFRLLGHSKRSLYNPWYKILKSLAYCPMKETSSIGKAVLVTYHQQRTLPWLKGSRTAAVHLLHRAQQPVAAKDIWIRAMIFHGLGRADNEPHGCQCLRLLFINPQSTDWHPGWTSRDKQGHSLFIPQVLVHTIATYLYHQDIIATSEDYFAAPSQSRLPCEDSTTCVPTEMTSSGCTLS